MIAIQPGQLKPGEVELFTVVGSAGKRHVAFP